MEKLHLDIISAVPESMKSIIDSSIIRIAREKGIASIHIHNLHDYAKDKFRHIDDEPYGGGAGMIIKCQVVFDCVEKLQSERDYDEVIFLTPDGETLNQSTANELSLKQNIILIAGHYKGIDQRIRDHLVTREISIGDYVLSGGELPALVLADSIIRLLPGVLGDAESALEDTFMDGLLEPPQYTRPADFRGWKIPDVLLSGHRAEILKWREDQSLKKTKDRRPDLLDD